jgi:membrane-bound serine protease (ClpP class)
LKRFRLFAVLILIMLILIPSQSHGESNDKVHVIPIHGEINRATKSFVRDALDDLNGKDVDAIIFDIDTYGGLINEASDIKDLIISTNIPTISYVNNKAGSAGVLITIASEKVVMAPNAMIGSAEPDPNTEKILSVWRSWLRDTANFRGRDSTIIEAMADRDIVVQGINEGGKLVNLTSDEAMRYGIADYISKDYHDIAEYFGYVDAEIIEKNENLQIKLAKYISNPYISSFILTIAFVGLVIEIFTPGFGLGGTISIIGFGLYFGGNILAGNSNWTSLAMFIVGLTLLIIEMIVPGFGLPGISGIIFVIIGVVLAMDSVVNAILSISIAIIITTIITIVLVKRGFESKLFKSVVLTSEHRTEKGYVSSRASEELLSKRGITVSELRPSGFVEIDGKRVDVLSDEGFMSIGTEVEVVRIEGSKIFVRRI